MASEPIDPEVAAFASLIDALEPLSHGARERVLKWAEYRFVRAETPEYDPEGFNTFMRSLVNASQQMGGMTGEDVLRASLKIVKEAEQIEGA